MERRSPYHYLDIETTGLDPARDELITLQYQNITFEGDPVGELELLRSWEGGERAVLERFYPLFAYKWDFIPVGFNLDFERAFLYHKFRDLLGRDLFQRLYRDCIAIDLQPLVILMQDGVAKGSSLRNWSPKTCGGEDVPGWYRAGEHDRILEYVRMEASSFLELYRLMVRLVPNYRRNFFNNVTWPVMFRGEWHEPRQMPPARQRDGEGVT
jgi:hypothetical protein